MKRVMLVDDDEEFLAEISEALREEGFNVVAFTNVESALKSVREKHPDIIFLDIQLEGISGLKLADELKKIRNTKRIPIVAVTGVYTEEAHQIIMKTFGIEKCLIKPVDIKKMIELIITV